MYENQGIGCIGGLANSFDNRMDVHKPLKTDCSAEFSAEYEAVEGFSVKCCRCGGNERVHNTSSFVGLFHTDTMKCIGVLKARVAELEACNVDDEEPSKKIQITEEMIRRGCDVVYGNGGIPFNPIISKPESYAVYVREILEVSLGIHEYEN